MTSPSSTTTIPSRTISKITTNIKVLKLSLSSTARNYLSTTQKDSVYSIVSTTPSNSNKSKDRKLLLKINRHTSSAICFTMKRCLTLWLLLDKMHTMWRWLLLSYRKYCIRQWKIWLILTFTVNSVLPIVVSQRMDSFGFLFLLLLYSMRGSFSLLTSTQLWVLQTKSSNFGKNKP